MGPTAFLDSCKSMHGSKNPIEPTDTNFSLRISLAPEGFSDPQDALSELPPDNIVHTFIIIYDINIEKN